VRRRRANNGRSRRNNRFTNSVRGGVVQERDLAPMRCVGSLTPPEYQANQTVVKKVRTYIDYTGAALTENVTPASLSTTDAGQYTGTSNARYTQLRILKVEAWFVSNTTSRLLFSVLDVASNVDFTDVTGVGIDYAHICYRPSLLTRSTYQAVAATTIMVVISVPALMGVVGQIVYDVTVAFD